MQLSTTYTPALGGHAVGYFASGTGNELLQAVTLRVRSHYQRRSRSGRCFLLVDSSKPRYSNRRWHFIRSFSTVGRFIQASDLISHHRSCLLSFLSPSIIFSPVKGILVISAPSTWRFLTPQSASRKRKERRTTPRHRNLALLRSPTNGVWFGLCLYDICSLYVSPLILIIPFR